ncbi:MAG: DEAD/DEAH box helicase [Bradyrhizobium sp.]|nr:DEAD/DEAH box helicase [Bradyrhizobium sp.]
MLTLRPDQRSLMDAARAQLRAGLRRVAIVAPTGFGKTVLTAHMFASAATRGFRSVFVLHRRELLGQASRSFTANGVPHGIIAAGIPADSSKLVQIATIGTLARQVHLIRPPRFVCFDECHHLPAPGWTSLQEAFKDAFHIGLSATPRRLDGQGLRDHFDIMVCGPSVPWLQKRGHLSLCRHYAPRNTLDLTGVRTRLGDYHRGDLVAAVDRSSIDGDAIAAYLHFAKRTRTLVFATSIEQSERIVEAFKLAGIPAEHVDGKTPATQRDAAIARFERGETLILSNVDLFGEGFDVPAIEAVMMLRPTKSLGLYLQMIGRALRVAHGKPYAVVLDLVGNYTRHGLVDDDRSWSLDAPAVDGDDQPRRLTVCAACDLVAEHRGFCTICGAPPKPYRQDELELWQQVVSEAGLAPRLRAMRRSELLRWADCERKLRLVALVLGFKRGWAWHRHNERLEIQRKRDAS